MSPTTDDIICMNLIGQETCTQVKWFFFLYSKKKISKSLGFMGILSLRLKEAAQGRQIGSHLCSHHLSYNWELLEKSLLLVLCVRLSWHPAETQESSSGSKWNRDLPVLASSCQVLQGIAFPTHTGFLHNYKQARGENHFGPRPLKELFHTLAFTTIIWFQAGVSCFVICISVVTSWFCFCSALYPAPAKWSFFQNVKQVSNDGMLQNHTTFLIFCSTKSSTLTEAYRAVITCPLVSLSGPSCLHVLHFLFCFSHLAFENISWIFQVLFHIKDLNLMSINSNKFLKSQNFPPLNSFRALV